MSDSYLNSFLSKIEGEGRYRIIQESTSGHCCFEVSVVDMQEDDEMMAGLPRTICECFSLADAKNITATLNAMLP